MTNDGRTLTLYSDGFWISPYVFTCFVALREKGVAFEVLPVKLDKGEQKAPDYRARTWTGRVPALAHGDFWLTESSAILEYIEETLPAPAHPRIFPEVLESRARARQLASWLRSDETSPVRAERSAEHIFYALPRAPLSAACSTTVAKVVAFAERLVTADRPNLFGAWSIVDAELAFFLQRLKHDEGLLTPTLRTYAEAQWKRPSVAEYVAHARPPFVPYG